jgi:GAF domain-containing protein
MMKMSKAEKAERYRSIQQRVESTLDGERNPITVMATVTAILKETFDHFYWVGFLLVEKNEMALGPFQGPPACLRLPLDSTGVCGTCFRTGATVLVRDTAAFQGRVGCDVVSKSEIAVPILVGSRVAAVLDIDSTELEGVDEIDETALQKIAQFVASHIEPIEWPAN